jgi:metal-sulfur cluster biosynthetic enzyme
MATKQKSVDKQVKEVLNQSPKVEEVEVKLKYEMPEELEDVNKHKWKGEMK